MISLAVSRALSSLAPISLPNAVAAVQADMHFGETAKGKLAQKDSRDGKIIDSASAALLQKESRRKTTKRPLEFMLDGLGL